MGASIGIDNRPKYITISNGAWDIVVDSVLAVAREKAQTDIEREYVAGLEREKEGFYPGYCPDFERMFPTDRERAFWCVCFRDAARWLCIGKLPNRLWAGSPAISVFHLYWCAELLTDLLRGNEYGGAVVDEDARLREQAREADAEQYRLRHAAAKKEQGDPPGSGR